MNALWWWIDRWRKSSAFMDMTLEQQGAYRNLLDEAALRGGPLPDDERMLAKACGDVKAWKRVRPVVMARFDLRPDGWHNQTLDEVYRRSLEISEQRSIAGTAGNKKRWGKHRKTIANASQTPSQTGSQTASQTPSLSISILSPISEQKNKERETKPLSPAARSDPFVNDEITQRAGDFLRRYRDELYPKHRNARYLGHEHRDYVAAVTLCQTWDDERLDKLAVCFLTTNHKFAAEGSRTVPQLRALASWLDGELATWERDHANQA